MFFRDFHGFSWFWIDSEVAHDGAPPAPGALEQLAPLLRYESRSIPDLKVLFLDSNILFRAVESAANERNAAISPFARKWLFVNSSDAFWGTKFENLH